MLVAGVVWLLICSRYWHASSGHPSTCTTPNDKHRHLLGGEVEELWQRALVRQARVGVAELVKECVCARLHGRDALVCQQYSRNVCGQAQVSGLDGNEQRHVTQALPR